MQDSKTSPHSNYPVSDQCHGEHGTDCPGYSKPPKTPEDHLYKISDEVLIAEVERRAKSPVIRYQETMQCDLDGGVYSDPTEILRFCILTSASGLQFKLCGECVTFLWAERHRSNADAPS